MSTEEDRVWDAEQDYALLGIRPVGGYPEDDEDDTVFHPEDHDETAEDEPVYYRHSIVEPPIYGAMDEHDPRL